ncbi:MAG: metallophosphoesterase [Roseburia sp.]
MKLILIIIIILVLVYIVWQYFELKKFKVTEYTIYSDKVTKEYTLAVVADLHGFTYGENNEKLLQAIAKARPDMICIPGDMIVGQREKTHDSALESLEQFVKIAPVYYSYGNHESKLNKPESAYYDRFLEYEKKVQKLGVHILNQRAEAWDDRLWISGLEIPAVCYKKGTSTPLPPQFLENYMPEIPRDAFHVMLAHNPYYAADYAKWGADLTLCGHYHGGLVRIPGLGSLISPQFQFFPKYDGGKYEIDGKHVIVSRGMGTHTFHIRIFNRAELLVVKIMQKH